MSITSYAQNFEDVLLWRALGHVTDGFYVDVGAQHPVNDSVSKAFYDNGWRGVHVEATPAYAELLRADRPDELVLQVALSDQAGMMSFFEIPDTGLSTGNASIAEHHRAAGYSVVEIITPCITLADVLAKVGSREIHWLKIDVEGMEAKVLEGWGAADAHPWVVVVESTYPNSQVETHLEWESELLERGYINVWFDGLSRFYVQTTRTDLIENFKKPPNIFDQFSLAATVPYCAAAVHAKELELQELIARERNQALRETRTLQENLTQREQELTAAVAKSDRRAAQHRIQLSKALTRLQLAHTAREQSLIEQLRTSTEAQRQTITELGSQHERRERVLTEELHATQELHRNAQSETEQLRQALDARNQQAVVELAAVQRLATTRQSEIETLLTGQIAREKAMSAALRDAMQQASQELKAAKEEARHGHAEQVAELKRRIADLVAELALQRKIAERMRKDFDTQIELNEKVSAHQMADLQAAQLDQLNRAQAAHDQREASLMGDLRLVRIQLAEIVARHDDLANRLERATSEAQEERLAAVAQAQHAVSRIEAIANEAKFFEGQVQQLTASVLAQRESGKEVQRELERTQQLLRRIRESWAWRLTLPVRFMGALLKPELLDTNAPNSSESAIHTSVAYNHPLPINTGARPPSEFPMANTSPPSSADFADTLDDLMTRNGHDFIETAYRIVLGRPPDPDGLNYYLKRLASGRSKIGLLAQLSKSPEARGHGLTVPGLERAIRIYRKGKLPLLGWFYRRNNEDVLDDLSSRRLRRLEASFSALGSEHRRQFDLTSAALAKLHLNLEQSHAVLVALQEESRKEADTDRPAAHAEPPGLSALSLNARRIYFELIAAASSTVRSA